MKLTIEQALQQGVVAHQEGKLQEAERLYRAILQSQPEHPDANHNLGVIAVTFNKANAALQLFKLALDSNPNIEQFWLSYIDALIKEKKFVTVEQVLGQAKKHGVDRKKLNSLEVKLSHENQNPSTATSSPPQVLLKSLVGHYKDGRYGDAEKLAVSLTQEFPKHQFGWKVLGAVLTQTGRISDSLGVCQNSVQLAPQDAEAHSNLGNTLQNLGRVDEAEASYTQAIALKPDFAEAHYNLGNMLRELGRLDEAEASYTKAIELKPEYAEAYSNLGITLQELGRLDEAEVSYTQAIALKPDFAGAHNNLGSTLQKLGKMDEAEASFLQCIELKSDNAEVHSNLGNMLQELGRLDEAEASYTKAIALKPDFAEAYNNLGATLKALGRLDEAEASYTQAIALEPDFAEAHNNLGNTLQELGRLEAAEARYKKAIVLKPDFAQAQNNLGNTFRKLGKIDEAELHYSQAIALKPNFADAYNNLGNTLQELGKLDEAEAIYKQAIALKPDFAEAFNNLGVTLKELGRLDEAEASYTQAIALKPNFALAHYELGKVFHGKGNQDLALKNIKQANSIEPQSKDYELMLSVMEAKKSRNGSRVAVGDTSVIKPFTGLISNLLILNREVEAELISSLYEMNSIQLDNTKRFCFLPSGKNDARYGNGRVSADFSLFDNNRPIIRKVAKNLKKLLMEALKSEIYIHESFFNILGAGGGTNPHAHLAADVDKDIAFGLGERKYSLVYYLDVGDQNCSEPGILKLYEPDEDILPCNGMITVFPASRMHSAVYSGTKDRVIIGVNFYLI